LEQVNDIIRSKCKSVYSAGHNLSIDESLLLFKGRLSFKQYVKTKRARLSVKFYELCTSNGILLNYFIYCGAKITKPPEDNPDNTSSTELIVVHLMKDYLYERHCLYIDNFYTTPKLAAYLLARKTIMCGTICKNRVNFPKELANETLDKGTASFCENKVGLLAVKFRALQDKSNKKPKVVHLLSTSSKADSVKVGTSRQGEDIFFKPTCIVEYNHCMRGVDVCDKQLHMIQTTRKTYKWYKKVFLRLMMQCILSTHKLYLLNIPDKEEHIDFLRFSHDVVGGLLSTNPRMNCSLSTLDTVSRLSGRYFL